MRRRVKRTHGRGDSPLLSIGFLYRFTFSNDQYRPTNVVAVVTASAQEDVLLVSRVESSEEYDSENRPPLPLAAELHLEPGIITAEMMIPDQPIPLAPE